MKQLRVAGVVALVAGSLALQAQVGAQATREAEKQFKAAQYKQEVQGDLKGAIEEYKKVAQGPDRALAARALLAMGETYQTLGAPDARGVFAQIVRDYTEPKEVVATARVRLAALAPRSAQREGMAPRLVLGSANPNIFAVSADGTLAVGLSGRQAPPTGQQPQLTIWNLSSGESRVLVANPGPGASASVPTISPSGREVAYRWTETIDGKPVVSMRVIGVDPGAKARVLPGPAGATTFGPIAWSPDGRSLLVGGQGLLFLDWLSLADGSYRRVKSFETWQQPSNPAVSPDGLIAYAAAPRQGSEDRHIFVLDSAGQTEVAVVNSAGFSGGPVWSQDGAHLVFRSNRSGTWALWSVGMRGARPSDDAVQVMTGNVVPLAVTRSGHLFYRTSNLTEFNQVAFVAELGSGIGQITKTFIGEGLSWSPDGQSLAYIRNTAAPPAVMIRGVETGEERAYPLPNLGLEQVRWLPDSSGVVVFASDSRSQRPGAMYGLDLKTGQYKRLVAIPQGRSAIVAVAPDGKSLYLSENGAGIERILGVDLASGTEREVARLTNGGQSASGLSISPDGDSLVVQTWADQPKRLGRLLIVKTDGTGTRELVPSFSADRTLSIVRWTADGRYIFFFTTADNGDWRLMRISPAGGPPEFAGLDSTKLTGTVRIPPPWPFSPLSMDVSPDGARVVFAFRPEPRFELWALENLMSMLNARQ